MKLVIQRVKEASVTIDDHVYQSIKEGYLIYVAFTSTDTLETVEKATQKVIKLRIYEDNDGKINNAIPESHDILCISQFTLYADTKGQNRPSFIDALQQEKALILYEAFIHSLNKHRKVKQGIFGRHMEVMSINDGPMTILIEL